MNKKNKAVDEYIAAFPKDVAKLLEKVRTTILKAAPKVEERISWRMPAYYQDGILILFAGHKKGSYGGMQCQKSKSKALQYQSMVTVLDRTKISRIRSVSGGLS